MNLSQLLEVTCAKPTCITDKLIKKDPKNTERYLNNLNETVIKYLGDDNYYQRVKTLINLISKDSSIKKKFLENVKNNNLYIEVPSFAKIRLRELLKVAQPQVNENVVFPLKLVKYMKQKLHCFEDLIINNDIVLPNIFVGPIYVQKLYKIASKLMTARDFGPLKYVTKQPIRGRAAGGGSAFGKFCPNTKINILLIILFNNKIINDFTIIYKRVKNMIMIFSKSDVANYFDINMRTLTRLIKEEKV